MCVFSFMLYAPLVALFVFAWLLRTWGRVGVGVRRKIRRSGSVKKQELSHHIYDMMKIPPPYPV